MELPNIGNFIKIKFDHVENVAENYGVWIASMRNHVTYVCPLYTVYVVLERDLESILLPSTIRKFKNGQLVGIGNDDKKMILDRIEQGLKALNWKYRVFER